MPILDYDNELTTTTGQAFTATAIGTKVLDGGAARDWGAGEEIVAYCRIVTAFDALTSVVITVECSAAAALTSATVLATSGTVLLAGLTINTFIPLGTLLAGTRKRFLGCRWTVTGSSSTVGKAIIGLRRRNAGQQGNVNFM
jgi:hypothetical protein